MRDPARWLRTCEAQKLAHDTARLEEQMHDKDIDFECEVCRKTFYVPIDEYDGRWDHPPGVPVCPECEDGGDDDYAYDAWKERQ